MRLLQLLPRLRRSGGGGVRLRLLPDCFPLLRNSAVSLSILSGVVYFFTSEGVAGFVGLLAQTAMKILHRGS
jgi:hypothetical protein